MTHCFTSATSLALSKLMASMLLDCETIRLFLLLANLQAEPTSLLF